MTMGQLSCVCSAASVLMSINAIVDWSAVSLVAAGLFLLAAISASVSLSLSAREEGGDA